MTAYTVMVCDVTPLHDASSGWILNV